MLLLNGIRFNPNEAFEHEGIQYPSNWYSLATPEERAAIGITEVPDPVRPDERFYYVQENQDGSFTSIPKDLEPIKEQFKEHIDITCGNIRAKIVAHGDFIAEEYRVAYDEATSFQTLGFTGNVPLSVSVWVDVSGMTPEQAALDIIATRNQYVYVLNSIRDLRLKAKASIDSANTVENLLLAVESFNLFSAALEESIIT